VALIASPATTGPNTLSLTGIHEGVQGVSLELEHSSSPGAPLEVAMTSSGHEWHGTAVLPLAGRWDVTALVRVDTFTEERGSCPLEISG
jgi:hypothetical protein